MLKKLNGQFLALLSLRFMILASGILDVLDRFGVKPIYYTKTNENGFIDSFADRLGISNLCYLRNQNRT